MDLSIGKSKFRYAIFLIVVFTLMASFLIFKPFGSKNLAINIFSSCAVDNIAGASQIDGIWVANKNSQLLVQGWVSDSSKKISAENVFLELIDKDNNVLRSVVQKSDFDRPDVEKAYNNPAMKFSGYNINLGLVSEPGDYTLLLGNTYPNLQSVCTNAFRLRISE